MTGGHTDLHAVRTAASHLRRGMTGTATFSLYPRRLPPDRGFLVSAGLDDVLLFLEGFRFERAELAYLRQAAELRDADVAALAELRFTGDVWAPPEGCVVFAPEPLLEVTAPLSEAQLVGTALLGLVTFGCTVATEAARYRLAAGGADLFDFAGHRAPGLATATAVARACAVAGFAGTSHVGAARVLGLPAVATMTAAYLGAFGDERAAFRAYAQDFPAQPVFLVDKGDVVDGVHAAVDVATELDLPDDHIGVRLSSGDPLEAARKARETLDEAGFVRSRIIVSGGLDEYELERLTGADAPIDGYGVGRNLAVPEARAVTAYRLVEYDGRPVADDDTLPGAKQAYRCASGEDDVLARRDDPPPGKCRAVLTQAMRGGRRVRGRHGLDHARDRLERDLRWLPRDARRLRAPSPVPVRLSPGLAALTRR
ncbi:nicotinate phosphoribosyltransferase [Amycolatopsis sacchari]|uniref:nicotinate phosphoribosyltransferase n=1 Tax=Amycolatopsis sacchari TaxID=115433 RepID=UPI003D70DEA5